MKLRGVVGIGLVSLLGGILCAAPAYARDGEIAEASRKPGGINPADIDWRCSIMAGRTDRAFIPCFLFDGQEPESRTAAVKFLIDNNLIRGGVAVGPGPLRIYSEEEARALGLIPPAAGPAGTGTGTYRRR